MTEKKVFTATQFNRAAAEVFAAAADGHQVLINNDSYKSGVFELTYRPRSGFSEPEPKVDPEKMPEYRLMTGPEFRSAFGINPLTGEPVGDKDDG